MSERQASRLDASRDDQAAEVEAVAVAEHHRAPYRVKRLCAESEVPFCSQGGERRRVA
jgi:hypothetical protein